MDLKPIIHVKLRLVHKQTEKPLRGSGIRVELYDNDLLEDDFLGWGTPGKNGCVDISFNSGDFKSWDSLEEQLPDLYFKVEREGEEIFRSPTAFNVDPKEAGGFNMEEGFIIDMGSWVIDPETNGSA